MRLAMGFPLKADEAYRTGLAQWLVPHEALGTLTPALSRREREQGPLVLTS